MCSAHHLIVLCIGVKFCENISNSISNMELMLNYDRLMDGQTLKILAGIT